tara:strand:+ start:2259 stop:2531 length:273 start_codon:yes stop_codon:yes gene_type:complete
MSQITIPSTSLSTLPIQPSGGTISVTFLQIFIICFLFMNCLMASFLLGMISKGKQRAGIKYFLPMIALAIPIFLVVQYIARSALSGLFNF